jgi:TolA-binding protein
VNLVEALRDGRLGPQERASMERHVAICAACAELARDLEKIGNALRAPREEVTPLEHQRARLALLRRATAPSPSNNAPGKMRFLLAAAALTMAVALGWMGARFTASPAHIAAVLHMPAPPRMASNWETALRPSNDARFERTHSDGLDVVTLAHGALDVTVRPLGPGERFVVRTSDAEIEAHGRAFRVEADNGKIRDVAVTEGSVEVRYAGFTAVIPSGGSWRATKEAALPAPSEAPPTTSAEPVKTNSTARTIVAAREKAPEPPQAAPHVSAAPEPPIVAPVEPAPVEPAPRVTPPSSRAFAEAMQALRRGDYAASAEQLDRFAKAYPSDARADEADYLRAIALQRAGRTAEAVAAARRYLASHPNGAHRVEAAKIAGR